MKNLTFVILLLTSLRHSQSYPPNDPYWSTQGWLTAMKVDYFWQQSNTFGDTNVVIAVMGLGVEITHEDLSDNIWINWNEIPNNGIDDDGNGYIDDYNGWNVINLTGNIMPDQINDGYAHETNVSGIISAKMNNNKGIVGIAPNSKILPVKFYDFGQSNSWKAEKLILAFNYVRDLQIQFPEKRFIINLSYGFTSFSPSERMLVSDAIEECYNLNIPIFCAAGNSPEPVEFPANLPFTLSVAELRPGISNLFNLPGYNNIGPENNFAAAGTALFTTSDNNTYDGFNGTSMASPIAAGIAALLLSVRNDLTPAQIDTIMKLTSEQVGDVDYYWNPDLPGHSQELGYGKLNAEYCLTRGLLDINFANNVEGNTNNFGQIKINGQWQPTNTTLPFILYNEIALEAENVLHNYNNYDNRFYNCSAVFNPVYSRNLNNIIVADYELETVQSLYKKTKPLTVRNYLEGGEGGLILFGEKDFDVINRISPYNENAFIYNQNFVPVTYKAEANQTHNLLNTTWRFYKWENGSANRIREEQINLSSPSEWKAIYKGIQRSDNSAAHSSNSQRKSVRTPNGQLANIYESLGTIWMENSTDNGQSWFILNNANPFVSEPSVNPAIDYFPWSSTHSSLAAVYYPHGILKVKVMKTNGTIDYNAVLPWDPGNGYPVVPSVAVSSNRILVVSTGGINGQNGLVFFLWNCSAISV